MAPAVLASLPALILMGLSVAETDEALQAGGIVTGALLLGVCGIVRDRGRALQAGLWRGWGGSPTLRRLRWRAAPDIRVVERLHGRIGAVLGDTLPTQKEEDDDPEDADRRYEEAIAALRDLTWDRRRFRLVFDENAEYGYRRNSLGLRPAALGVAIATLLVSLGILIFREGDLERWGSSATIALILLGYWFFVVTNEWVQRSAELYADRLLETLETLRRA